MGPSWLPMYRRRSILFSRPPGVASVRLCFCALRFYWATVCKTVRPMLSVRCAVCPVCPVCLSVCLSVTLVYCGQTVRRIKMKLDIQVGLGPGHIVLHGDPAPPHLKGHSPSIFGPYLWRPNGCMDQDVTWYGGRPRSRRLCVRWAPSPPPQKGAESPQIFGPCSLWPNG